MAEVDPSAMEQEAKDEGDKTSPVQRDLEVQRPHPSSDDHKVIGPSSDASGSLNGRR